MTTLEKLGITKNELDAIQKLCEKQWDEFNETGEYGKGCIYFDSCGQAIINPFVDSTGRFDLLDVDAIIEEYGFDDIQEYFMKVLKYLNLR